MNPDFSSSKVVFQLAGREKIVIGVIIVLLIIGVTLRLTGTFSGMNKISAPEGASLSQENEDTGGSDEEKYITIHVVGSVANPGIYNLPSGARVNDVVNKAGGPTGEADLARINLARPLFDGEQIIVPGQAANGEPVSMGSTSDGKVNINRASLSELTTLNGIGETRARNIINYRDASGPFTDIEDVMNVPNIGTGIFEGIKDHITIY